MRLVQLVLGKERSSIVFPKNMGFQRRGVARGTVVRDATDRNKHLLKQISEALHCSRRTQKRSGDICLMSPTSTFTGNDTSFACRTSVFSSFMISFVSLWYHGRWR